MFKPVIGLERGLTDPVVDLNMGQTAEILAQFFNISRLDADTYAMESHHRLAKAQKDGVFAGELEPMFLERRQGLRLRRRRATGQHDGIAGEAPPGF